MSRAEKMMERAYRRGGRPEPTRSDIPEWGRAEEDSTDPGAADRRGRRGGPDGRGRRGRGMSGEGGPDAGRRGGRWPQPGPWVATGRDFGPDDRGGDAEEPGRPGPFQGRRGHRGHGHHGRPGPGGFGPGGFGPRGFGPGGFGPGDEGRGRGRGGRRPRGNVRAAVLALLAEEPRRGYHGYAIMAELSERSGGLWRPSPGSVYPVLQQLQDEGLIAVEESDGGRKVFTITDAGAQTVQQNPAEYAEPWATTGPDQRQRAQTLFQGMGALGQATAQVAQLGTDEQVEQARQALDQARRRIYLILAAEAPAPEGSGQEGSGQEGSGQEGPGQEGSGQEDPGTSTPEQ